MGGDGKDTKAADVVVNEIKAKNGIAVANYGKLRLFYERLQLDHSLNVFFKQTQLRRVKKQ